MRPISVRLTREVSQKCLAQSDVEIFITRFFWKNGQKKLGDPCLHPIRVVPVTIRAITDNY